MKVFAMSLMLAAGLLFANCGGAGKEEENASHEELPPNIVEMNDDQYKMAGIVLGSMEEKTMSHLIRAAGTITVPPQNLATVCSSFGGYIKSTSLLQGSVVKKGAVLAMIENPEFVELQQEYLESADRLQFLKEEADRQEKLYKDNVASAKTYQHALAEYKSMKSKLSALEQKLSLIGISGKDMSADNIRAALPLISPISGTVKSVNVNIGKYVSPTDVLFEIVNTDGLTLEVEVFEKDAGKIRDGQQIRFSVLSLPERELTAKVYQSGKALDNDKGVTVYAHIEADDVKLMPGMAVNAFIETEEATVTALPAEAVVSFDDRFYIFVFKGKRTEGDKQVSDFEAIEVRTGHTENGYTEVILPDRFETLKAKVVVKGAYQVLSAMKNSGEMAC